MPKILIFGTSWCPDQERKWLLEQWIRINRTVNPDCHALIVDSASPALPERIDGGMGVMFEPFQDNIGHLSRAGRDGWGRAFVKGLEWADRFGYDFAVHVEADLLMARPVAPIIDKMARHGVGAAAPIAHPYQYIETALLFLDMRWVRESEFIARYDWANPPPAGPLPELRVEAILGDKFWPLPLRGARNDLGTITAKNMGQVFPQGISWLTHANTATFRAFLALNGLQEA